MRRHCIGDPPFGATEPAVGHLSCARVDRTGQRCSRQGGFHDTKPRTIYETRMKETYEVYDNGRDQETKPALWRLDQREGLTGHRPLASAAPPGGLRQAS